jgi:transcription-repair coupling factor (superfamily II helicase)
MLAKIGQGIPVDGMESLAPALVKSLGQVSDYLAKDAYVVLLSPEKAMARAANLIETNEEFLHAAWDAALEGAKAPIDLSAGGFKSMHEFTTALDGRQLISISSFLADETHQISLNLLEIPNFKGMDVEPVDYISDQLSQGQQVVIASPGHGTAQRIAEILEAAKIPAKVIQAM